MKPEDLLQHLSPNPVQKCTLGCPILDRFLGGGIPCNSITELVAESGCGKTQISLQLLLSAQLPTSLGGLSASSLYLFSESPFPLRRLHQLSSSFPTLHNPMDNILTHPLHSAHHLFDVLSQIDSLLLSRPTSFPPIKLIVIDSIAALFRFEFENNARDLKQRSGLFFKISSKLKEQARRFGLAVVVINQVVDVIDDSDSLRIGSSTCLYTSQRKVSAALGLSWANCVNTRLFLSRNEERVADEDCFTATRTRRFIRVVFAPHLPDSSCEFVITREKVFGLER
ncbi:PREDICTED: DNA repair protein XRCC3 homolog [Nicotiana attenuata]|uniref:Dna repair protein xrcc3-like protein n=1 Tax=Nicotiana attenuata TaxID=49451 RepID=A0A1J6KKW0_NICAT|nr:PREDICTED: DNA repair protein XRCC3 homolog [Nicotiana attenuata]OIT19881.1 dna repair protein xrcc3-like protein [Nicotiana attenuata]